MAGGEVALWMACGGIYMWFLCWAIERAVGFEGNRIGGVGKCFCRCRMQKNETGAAVRLKIIHF